jgi:hypothetical protein
MNASVPKVLVGAALLAVPIFARAQAAGGVFPTIDRTGNMTLLTGPTFTSPAGKRTLTPQGWVLGTPAGNAVGRVFNTVEVVSINGRRAGDTAMSPEERNAEQELRAAQEKLDQARAKLARLRAERESLTPKQSPDDSRILLPTQPPANLLKFETTPKGAPADLNLKLRGAPVRTETTTFKRD